jgi:hypothetical protein
MEQPRMVVSRKNLITVLALVVVALGGLLLMVLLAME